MSLSGSARVYLILVFLSGALVGGVTMQLFNSSTVTERRGGRPPRSPEEARRRYGAELKDRLKLSEDQAKRLGEILDSTHLRYKALREKYQPDVRAIMDEQADQIRGILNDGQKKEYDRMREEREKHRPPQQSRDGSDARRLTV